MISIRAVLSVLLIGAIFHSPVLADEEQMRTVVYPITFGEQQALEEVSKSVVGEDGHVVLDKKRGRLIIVTFESIHDQLQEILQPSEKIPANISIAVNMNSAKRSHSKKAALHGSGGVIFESGEKPAGSIVLRPELENRKTEMSSSVGQQLMVADGRTASLRVGEDVPYLSWIMDYGWNHGYYEQRIDWQEVGSFLTVTPTILSDGETIRVTLTPQLRGMVNGNPFHTSFVDLSTEVIVRNGQTVQIGGAGRHEDFYSKFLIGFNSQGMQESLNIDLTPTIRKPYAPVK